MKGIEMKPIGSAVKFMVSILVMSSLVHAEDTKGGWSESFSLPPGKTEKDKICPKNWEIKGKIGTPNAEFYIKNDDPGAPAYLFMEADKASASAVCNPDAIDLEKFPVMSWKWKVQELPAGADGRDSSKDDQAIGIYIGTGSVFSKKSVSYRWDTETPDGSEGNCSYGAGTIKIKWFTLRNKGDLGKGENGWFIEKRNVLEDFKKAWGFVPTSIYISVSCNSQYTGSKASAMLEWIKFLPKTEN